MGNKKVVFVAFAIEECYVPHSFRPSDLKYPPVRQDLIRNIS